MHQRIIVITIFTFFLFLSTFFLFFSANTSTKTYCIWFEDYKLIYVLITDLQKINTEDR